MSNFSHYQPGVTLPIVSFVMNTETTATVQNTSILLHCNALCQIEVDGSFHMLLQKYWDTVILCQRDNSGGISSVAAKSVSLGQSVIGRFIILLRT